MTVVRLGWRKRLTIRRDGPFLHVTVHRGRRSTDRLLTPVEALALARALDRS